jgi:hypothetical protein
MDPRYNGKSGRRHQHNAHRYFVHYGQRMPRGRVLRRHRRSCIYVGGEVSIGGRLMGHESQSAIPRGGPEDRRVGCGRLPGPQRGSALAWSAQIGAKPSFWATRRHASSREANARCSPGSRSGGTMSPATARFQASIARRARRRTSSRARCSTPLAARRGRSPGLWSASRCASSPSHRRDPCGPRVGATATMSTGSGRCAPGCSKVEAGQRPGWLAGRAEARCGPLGDRGAPPSGRGRCDQGSARLGQDIAKESHGNTISRRSQPFVACGLADKSFRRSCPVTPPEMTFL